MGLKPIKPKYNNKLINTMMVDLQEELDIIESFKKRRHLDCEILAALYDLLLKEKIIRTDNITQKLKDKYNITSKAPDNFGGLMADRTISKYISILCQVDDFHRTFQFNENGYGRWYVMYATQVEAKLCKKRHISLLTFMIDLRKILDKFHKEALIYHNKRMNRLKPPKTMTSLKEEYEIIIKKIKGENFKARKYLRTEHDLVILEIGDSRKGFRKEVYKK
jgi:pullulanase/glycogen debranching enzyme